MESKAKGGRPSRPGQVQLNVRVPEEAAEAVRALAKSRGLSLGDMVAMLIQAEAIKHV